MKKPLFIRRIALALTAAAPFAAPAQVLEQVVNFSGGVEPEMIFPLSHDGTLWDLKGKVKKLTINAGEDNVTVIEFDEQGRVTDNDGTRYTYDDQGRLTQGVSERSADAQGTAYRDVYDYAYDAQGWLVACTHTLYAKTGTTWTKDGTPSTHRYAYDDRGGLATVKSDEVSAFDYAYTDGRLTKANQTRYKWNPANGQLQAYAGLTDGMDGSILVTGALAYNTQGFIARLVQTEQGVNPQTNRPEGKKTSTTTDYRYTLDSQGNWTRVTYSADGSDQTIRRTIEYYP